MEQDVAPASFRPRLRGVWLSVPAVIELNE
jgi:hypothetical protein